MSAPSTTRNTGRDHGIFEFPFKLHELLDSTAETGDEHIICWHTNGHAFRIVDRKAFEETIMPRFFAQIKYKSFIRQLNIYGFTRVRAQSSTGGSNWCYYHPFFAKGQPDLCHAMKRCVRKQSGHAGEKKHGHTSKNDVFNIKESKCLQGFLSLESPALSLIVERRQGTDLNTLSALPYLPISVSRNEDVQLAGGYSAAILSQIEDIDLIGTSSRSVEYPSSSAANTATGSTRPSPTDDDHAVFNILYKAIFEPRSGGYIASFDSLAPILFPRSQLADGPYSARAQCY